jgi:hypothetical protein
MADLELTVNEAAQRELCACAGLAQALAGMVADRTTQSDEYAEVLANELAERMWQVYRLAFTPDMTPAETTDADGGPQ